MKLFNLILAFFAGVFGRGQCWQFRTRFVNEYNSWILEIKENEGDGWKPVCHRRRDADHDLMVVKFRTRHLALEHAQETGLTAAYSEVRTNVKKFFGQFWEYRIRLDIDVNQWLIELKAETAHNWTPLYEYISIHERSGAFHRINLGFENHEQAAHHANKIGLSGSYSQQYLVQGQEQKQPAFEVVMPAAAHPRMMSSAMERTGSISKFPPAPR